MLLHDSAGPLAVGRKPLGVVRSDAAVSIACSDRRFGRRLCALLVHYDVVAAISRRDAAVQVVIHNERTATIHFDGKVTPLRRWAVEDLVHALDVASGRVAAEVPHHELGRLKMIGPTSELHLDDTPIVLTRTERRLVRYLIRNPTAVHPRALILEHAWPLDYTGRVGVVDTFVSYVRHKLGDDWRLIIRTAYGDGYSIHAPWYRNHRIR